MIGVDSSRPSRPTTNLNVGAVVDFGGFDCSDWDPWWLVFELLVPLSLRVILLIIIFIVHGGQVQTRPEFSG